MLHELGHGAYDIGFDRDAPLAPARHASHHDGGDRDPDGPTRAGGGLARGRCRARRDEAADLDGRAARGPGGGAPRLRALGARDDELRARVLRRPRGRPRVPWWDLVSRYQLLTPPEGRDEPDWAAKIHVACAPVYYHTYLYGHLVASQVRRHDRSGGRRPRRPARGRRAPLRADLPAGPVAAVGPPARGVHRRAAHRGARRPIHRARAPA